MLPKLLALAAVVTLRLHTLTITGKDLVFGPGVKGAAFRSLVLLMQLNYQGL